MISIIIPVYNGEKYIIDCIKSIEKQNYNDYELIIINDGSIDKTYKLINDYMQSNSKIKLFNFTNHGVSWSRNYGISQASGDYIMFLDCDDVLDDNYINEVMSNFNPSIDAVFTKISVVDVHMNLLKVQSICSKLYTSSELLEILLDFKNLNIGPCGKVFRRDLIKDKIKFKDIKVYEDLCFNIDVLKQDCQIYFNNNVGYNYIQRDNVGTMSSFIKSPSTDVIKAMEYSIETINSLNNFDYLFYRILCQVMIYLVDCDYKKDIHFIREAQKFIRKYYKEIVKNKTINKFERILYILYSISFRGTTLIRRLL